MCSILRRIVPGLACALALAALGHRLTTGAPAAELAAPPTQSAATPLVLKSGDRVVLLGGTFIEREQKYGYFEAALVSRFPGEKIIVRNLGWSGDTVWCDSRAGFGSPADGFARLSRQLQELKPTVAIVAYGNNEAYAGPAGLDRFVSGLKTLLDALAPGGRGSCSSRRSSTRTSARRWPTQRSTISTSSSIATPWHASPPSADSRS